MLFLTYFTHAAPFDQAGVNENGIVSENKRRSKRLCHPFAVCRIKRKLFIAGWERDRGLEASAPFHSLNLRTVAASCLSGKEGAWPKSFVTAPIWNRT